MLGECKAYFLPPVLQERLWTRHGVCLAQHVMVWIVEFHLWCYLKNEIPDLMNCTDDRLCCSLSFVGHRTRKHHLIVVEFPEDLFWAILRVSLDCGSLRVGTANNSVTYLTITFIFWYFPGHLKQLVNNHSVDSVVLLSLKKYHTFTFLKKYHTFPKVSGRSNGDSHLCKTVTSEAISS